MTGPPLQLGDYLRGELIGEGGMGAVYRTQHVTTGAPYALKLLPRRQDLELCLRFEREGRALATLSGHPNVVRVHTAGQQDGWLYLVQELVTGGSLEERVAAGPLPPEVARAIAISVGRGLVHVHAHQMLHRDLKPANVLLTEDGTPRLVDFGLARVADGRSLTQTGDVLGSPSWMAPEQAVGEPADERSDVYGLGAVLYHCLTGRPPVEGGSLLAVLDRVVNQEPLPPQALAPGVPAWLGAVCLRSLAKRPADRYASVQDLLDALETPGVGAGSRGWRWLAVAGGVLVAVGWVAVSQRAEPRPLEPVAVAASQPAPAPTPPPVEAPPQPRWTVAMASDAAVWRAARGGDPEACRVVGEHLLARGLTLRAARWLKAAGRAVWVERRGEFVSWARRRREQGQATPREQLNLVWTLIAPLGKHYGDPEQPVSELPQDLTDAKRILSWLSRPGQEPVKYVRRLRESLKKPQSWTPPEGVQYPGARLKAARTRAHLLHFLLRDAHRLATGRHRVDLGIRYGSLVLDRMPEEAIRIHRELLRSKYLDEPTDQRRALDRILPLLWNADPDQRDVEALIEFAWKGARLQMRNCAQVLCTVLRSRGGVAPSTLAELRKVFDTVEPTDLMRLDLAEIYLQQPGATPEHRELAMKQIRLCSQGLRQTAPVEVLSRLLQAYATAQGYEPGFRAKYERQFPNLSERQRLLILMESSGLPGRKR